MDRFVHRSNLEHYRHLIAQSERDANRDDARHKVLLSLLADEEAKDHKPLDQ